jgi:hypothetical protein
VGARARERNGIGAAVQARLATNTGGGSDAAEENAMTRTVYHLVHRDAADRWELEEGGRAVADFPSKEEGEEEGRRRSRALRDRGLDAQLVVHRQDGSIETEYTYGHDPRRRTG